MHALTYLGPWEMAIVDRPDRSPAPGEVTIDVIATGICGSDAHGYTGDTGRRVGGQIMGHETVGRVRTGGSLPIGSLVTVNPIVSCGRCDFCQNGDTQACAESAVIGVEPTLDGSFADQLVIPERNVIALGERMPVLHGALIEPLAVGFHAVMRAEPTTNDTLLVIGGGPIGQAAALGARRLGLTRILVSEPATARSELLESLGFPTTTPDELSAAMERVLDGKATVVVDAVGIAATVTAALTHSTTRARVVLVGMGAKEMTIAPYELSVAERTLIGSYCYSEDHFRSTADWVAQGHPELDRLIDRVLPLDEGPGAFRDIADGSGGSNKTLLASAAGTELLAGDAIMREVTR